MNPTAAATPAGRTGLPSERGRVAAAVPRSAGAKVPSETYKTLVHRAVKGRLFGEAEGYEVWRVDGLWIRDNIDPGFAGGTNFGRDAYVPSRCVWVEAGLSDKDTAAAIIHQVVDADALIEGLDPVEAKENAAAIVTHFRQTWDGEGSAWKAAAAFLASATDEDEMQVQAQRAIEVDSDDVDDDQDDLGQDQDEDEEELDDAPIAGLELRRTGFQRYKGSYADAKGKTHKVWIGGGHEVDKGSYAGNTRQRRKMVWTVKVDGKEVGSAGSLREAKGIAETKLGIERPPEPAAMPVDPMMGGQRQPQVPGMAGPVLAPPVGVPDPLAVLRSGGRYADRQRAQAGDRDVLRAGRAGSVLPGHGRPPAGHRSGVRARERGAWTPGGFEVTADDLDEEPPRHVTAKPKPKAPQPSAKGPPKTRPEVGGTPISFRAPEAPKSGRPPDKGWLPQPWRAKGEPDRTLETPVYNPNTRALEPWAQHRKDPSALRRSLDSGFDPALIDQDYLELLQTREDLGMDTQPKQHVRDPATVALEAINALGDADEGAAGYRNILALMQKATPEEVDYWAHWYGYGHVEAVKLAEKYNRSVDLVAGVIAVLSPKEFWQSNLYLADRALAEDWENVRALDPSRAKAYSLVVENDFNVIGGGKVSAFFLSIADPVKFQNEVVVDTHAINIWRGIRAGEAPSLSPSTRAKIAADYTAVAGVFGLSPQAVQAITWVLWRQFPTLEGTAPIEAPEGIGKGRMPAPETPDSDWSAEQDLGDDAFTAPLGVEDYRTGMLQVSADDLGDETQHTAALPVDPSGRRPPAFDKQPYAVLSPKRVPSGGPDFHDVPAAVPKRDPTFLAPPGRLPKGAPENLLKLKPDGGYTNIMKVLQLATPEEREYWGKWYPFAAAIVREMAGRYDLSVEQVAGVVAVLSPGSKWHGNIAVAKQVIEHWKAQQDYGPFSAPALSGVGGPVLPDARPGAGDGDIELGEDDLDQDESKVAQLGRPYDWKPKKTQPDDAPHTEFATKGPPNHPLGLSGPHPAGYPNNIQKAMAILNGAPPESVVTGPKVTIFYKSLLDPSFVEDHLVLDGHAINIWRGTKQPLKGLDSPTEDSPERTRMLADYAKAARASGLSVQAVQAITWFIYQSVKNLPTTTPAELEQANPAMKPAAPAAPARRAELEFDAASAFTFPAKERALHLVLDDAGIPYPPDMVAVDAAYGRWKSQYAAHRLGPRPVYAGGELDAVNEILGLRGNARVSGLLEAWERLTIGVRSWLDPRVLYAIDVLRDVPGLEGLRPPEFVLHALMERKEKEEMRDQPYDAPEPGDRDEVEPVSVGTGDLDFDFDVSSARHGARDARVARLRSEDAPGESACVVLPIPEALAKGFAPKEQDSSPPHVTVLYIGAVPRARFAELEDIIRDVAGDHDPLPLKFREGVEYFENDEGQTIANKGIDGQGLTRLHQDLRREVEAAGFEIEHHDGFIAHATLAYLDGPEYQGECPEGAWTARTIELWGLEPKEAIFPLEGVRMKAAFVLGGAIDVEVDDLDDGTDGDDGHRTAAEKAGARKRRREEKRKRFAGEVYWRSKDSAFAFARENAAGNDAVEIRLDPGARVLREGERDFLALGADASEEAILAAAFKHGYDAVRVRDRLAIINQDAVAESTPSKRPGWSAR